MKVRPLSEPFQDMVINELNEISNNLEEELENFRSWLSKQDHLKYRNDDQLLVNFLRGSKHSMQRAKEKIDAFYTFRTVAPEIGRNLDPLSPELQLALKLGFGLPLPTPKDNPTSPRVFLGRFEDYDPDEFTFTSMLKAGLILINIFFNEDDNFVISGCKVIWDMKGIHFKTALQATPTMVKKGVYCYEKALPTRLKAMYIINAPTFLEQALNIAKMLIPKKIANRVYIYSNNNWEEIHKDIPKSILPKEYGGDTGPIEVLKAEIKKRIEGHRDALMNENNYYSDESKRLGTPKMVEDVFGAEGSFRKLEVD